MTLSQAREALERAAVEYHERWVLYIQAKTEPAEFDTRENMRRADKLLCYAASDFARTLKATKETA